jgi:hypothetical protein
MPNAIFYHQTFGDKAIDEHPWGNNPYLLTPLVVIILGVWSWVVFGHKACYPIVVYGKGLSLNVSPM